MTFKFCPQCGEKLTEKVVGDEGSVPFCEHCNRPWFSISYPCVIVLAVNEENEIALIRQNYVSTINYVCVAGYIKAGETAEYTVKREVEEEIGLEVIWARFIKSFYYPKCDNLMLGFVCDVKKKDFSISKEVDSAKWFSLQEAVKQLREGSIAHNLLVEFMDKE
jgi:NTP pyrophosphohydrolases containing a Zn-finger, probably nucleic-acid-binding